MTSFKSLLAMLSILLCLPAFARSFDPEKDVSVSFKTKDGAVVVTLPAKVHATEISVDLKAGSSGKISAGPFPPYDGADSFGSKYWVGAIRIPVKGEGLKDPVALIVTYMTCMEGEGGMCFPPVDKELKIRAAEIPGNAPAITEPKSSETVPITPADAKPLQTNAGLSLSPSAAAPSDNAIAPAAAGITVAPTATGIGGDEVRPAPAANPGSAPSSTYMGSLLKILILFFLGGIGASLTPCVLPMIPITMAVIGARSASKARGLLLGIVLTQGMALTYTVLGVIAALTGSVFGQFAQQPGFLIPVSLIFAIFAISLLGAFEIRLPDSITSKLQSSAPRNGILGAFVTGLILGPLSAPCVGPLIGAAILDIGMNRQVFEGALKMFIFAQGMGVLFIIGGIAVSALPKSGDWLTRFKQTLGVIILAFAAWNIRLVVPEWMNYLMWAITLLVTSGVFGAFEAAAGLLGNIRKGFALLSFAMAVLLGIRAAEHYLDIPLLPLGGSHIANAEPESGGIWIEHDYEEALDRARTEDKLLLIDTFTTWCAQCKELDEKTWPDPNVAAWINANAVAVRIDTEKIRPDLAKPLNVRAYPTIILMDAQGNELRRLFGFHRPEKMLEWLSMSGE